MGRVRHCQCYHGTNIDHLSCVSDFLSSIEHGEEKAFFRAVRSPINVRDTYNHCRMSVLTLSRTFAAFVADAVVCIQNKQGNTADENFQSIWKTTISQQAVQTCCLVASCAIFIGRFLSLIQTGWGIENAINTSAPVELRATYGSTHSEEALTGSAAPMDGGNGQKQSSSGSAGT